MSTSDPGDERAAVRVRSFTLTSGRTLPIVELPLEATLRRLGSAEPVAAPLTQVLELCDQRSVAEVAALMAMPIGVARVLVADLVEMGHVRVLATLQDDSSHDERRDLIERTLRGLRTL